MIAVSLISVSALSKDSMVFRGHIQNSQYENLNGRECSLVLNSTKAEGAQTVAYIARPKIEGINPTMNKRRAPLESMNINDLEAFGDTYSAGRKNVLVGHGSKYRRELSQGLYVNFSDLGDVTSWDYRDGAETFYGYTYSCE